MNNINDLREELLRRKAAEPQSIPRKLPLKQVFMASLTLVVLAAVAAAASML